MDTLFFFIAGLLLFIYITITKFNSLDSNKNLPPQPWRLPIIGHIHHLLGAPPHHALRNIARKLGPVVCLQLGQVSAVIISSPEMAKEILKTHDIRFASRPKSPSLEVLTYNYKDVAFAPYGDYWRQMRKICVLELLSARKVEFFRCIREQESWDLIESIATTQRLKTINLSDKIYNMINTIITRISIGSSCKDQAMLLDAIQEGMELSGGFDASDLFPSVTLLPLITGTRSKMMKIRNKADVIWDNIILDHKERRINGPSKHVDEDLVDVLLRLKDEGGLEFPLTVDHIKAVILGLFAAGSDTSAVTIEWAMSELMKNPMVMKKAQDEIRQAFKGKTKIHESDIQELHYLKLVIKETLRLHPPAPFLLPRECQESCEIGGFRIPADTKVLINTWMIGRDPDYWIDPESFKPERFSETSINTTGTNFEYLPFGAGRRMCPGMLLGITNVELPLAMLLYHFDWELPNGQASNDFDMLESFGTILKRKNGLLLVPHPHNTSY